jgi:hypothetical protein
LALNQCVSWTLGSSVKRMETLEAMWRILVSVWDECVVKE